MRQSGGPGGQVNGGWGGSSIAQGGGTVQRACSSPLLACPLPRPLLLSLLCVCVVLMLPASAHAPLQASAWGCQTRSAPPRGRRRPSRARSRGCTGAQAAAASALATLSSGCLSGVPAAAAEAASGSSMAPPRQRACLACGCSRAGQPAVLAWCRLAPSVSQRMLNGLPPVAAALQALLGAQRRRVPPAAGNGACARRQARTSCRLPACLPAASAPPPARRAAAARLPSASAARVRGQVSPAPHTAATNTCPAPGCRVWPKEDERDVQLFITLVHHVTGALCRQRALAPRLRHHRLCMQRAASATQMGTLPA